MFLMRYVFVSLVPSVFCGVRLSRLCLMFSTCIVVRLLIVGNCCCTYGGADTEKEKALSNHITIIQQYIFAVIFIVIILPSVLVLPRTQSYQRLKDPSSSK